MDYLCRPDNTAKHEAAGRVKCVDKAKIAALNKHSRQAVESGKMVLMTNAPRPQPEKKAKK